MMTSIRIIGLTGAVETADGKFLGVKQAGKSTVAEMIKTALAPDLSCEIVNLSDPLKQLVCSMYGLDIQAMEQKKEEPIESVPGHSYRGLLQIMGTDVVRERMLFPQLWPRLSTLKIRSLAATPGQKAVHAWFDVAWTDILDFPETPHPRLNHRSPRDMAASMESIFRQAHVPEPQPKPIVAICPDIRFPNEYQWAVDLGAKIVHVRRIVDEAIFTTTANTHASNCRYEGMRPDYVITNNGTVQELEACVRQCVGSLFAP